MHKTPTDPQTFACLHKVCLLTITPSVVAKMSSCLERRWGAVCRLCTHWFVFKMFCNVDPSRRCPRRRAKVFPSPATFTATRGTGQTQSSSPRPSSPLSVSDGHVTSQMTEFGFKKGLLLELKIFVHLLSDTRRIN